MKLKKDDVLLILFFVCAVFMALVWVKPAPVNAEGVLAPLFDSPPPDPPNWVDVGEGGPARDPETPDISLRFEGGAMDENVEVRAYEVGGLEGILPTESGLIAEPVETSTEESDDASQDDDDDDDGGDTPGGSALASSFEGLPTAPVVSNYFASGVWIRGGVEGKGTTMQQFDHSVIITTKYDPGTISPEDKVYMYMYNPQVDQWVKLCSLVDRSLHEVSGLVTRMTPYEPNGNALFAIGVDNTTTLEQIVDSAGNTRLVLPDLPEVSLNVPPGTVEMGDNFEITPLRRTNSSIIVDYKVCRLNHFNKEESIEVLSFDHPVVIEFDPETQAFTNGTDLLALYQDQWFNIGQLQTTAELLDSTAIYTYNPAEDQVTAKSATSGVYGVEVVPDETSVLMP